MSAPKKKLTLSSVPKKHREGIKIVMKPEGKTDEQESLIESLDKNVLTVCDGPAGCGKTYISCLYAAWLLDQGLIERILLTRSATEAVGEKLGFLPGSAIDKVEPYMLPMLSYLEEIFGKTEVETMREVGIIQIIPLAYMRGITIKKTFIILDEAQNTTPKQMRLLLTRVGDGTKIIVEGDLHQRDNNGGFSGLEDAAIRLGHCSSVGVVQLTNNSIMRSPFVKEIEEAYELPSELDAPTNKGLDKALLQG